MNTHRRTAEPSLTRRSLLARLAAAAVAPALLGRALAVAPEAADRFSLQDNDVVALIGGEWVVQEGEAGHFESLLAAASADRQGVKFRNLGWEGDTVFEQPRDVNFPGLPEQVRRVNATVVFAQFGAYESFAGPDGLEKFVAAYEGLCDELAKPAKTIVLVTPPPFEKPADPALPDPSVRNEGLRQYADAVRALAGRRGYRCVDLFTELSGRAADAQATRLTDDALRPTPRGSAILALAAARSLGLDEVARRAGEPDAQGRWGDSAETEALRLAVVEKNRLWFDYWRPMNWAFLGGDRTFVPSSHDHNDPSVRWFPAEMEKFVPLIEQAEGRAGELARAAAGAGD